MTIYEYIASKNPSGANDILENYGFKGTTDQSTLSSRLKAIVRKYKKIALKDISLIHPDKDLLSQFTTATFEDRDFVYASGVRSPEFLQEPEEEDPVKDTGFTEHPLPITPKVPQKVLDVIKELKKQVKTNQFARIEAEKRELERLNIGNISGFNQTNLLMSAVAFALGYMIAKNKK